MSTAVALSKPQIPVSGLDRTFLYGSSVLNRPLCTAYELVRYRLLGPIDSEKFDNYPIVQEVAFRALIAVGVALAVCLLVLYPIAFLATVLTLGVVGKILRGIGFALQEKGYTHVKTDAPEIPMGDRTTVALQNFCAMAGGMHYDRGGVPHWSHRIDGFVEEIRAKRPHTIVIQEEYDTDFAEALVEKLGDIYPHFFMHLGANLIGSVGGVMMITDHPVDAFTNISFNNNDWTLNRTFAVMDIGNLRIIGTHLIHGDAHEKRKEQVEQMMDFIADQKDEKITIIAADYNTERDREGREILDPYLEHGYKGMEPTCTSKLTEQWTGISAEDEIIDNISQVKPVQLPDGRWLPVVEEFRIEELEILTAFDQTYNTKKARSDHQGMLATIRV